MAERPVINGAIGLVVGSHGRHVVVESPDGVRIRCHGRGKKTHPVVGDRVRWQPAGDEGVVEQIEPRRNLLFRQDDWRTKSFAANLDQVLVLVAGEPVFSETQLARALIAASEAGIATRIGLNKTDLPSVVAARERLQPYTAMGVPVMELALKADAALARDRLGTWLDGRVTLILGPSGAGKSTLINLLVPAAQASVGEISQALNSGRHTTTTTSLYWLDADRTTALIDSPGFQEFGLRQVEAPSLAAAMPDIAAALGHCRFYNCTHRQEPGCGVRDAADAGTIAPSRYRIYLELFEELSGKRW